MRDRDRRHNLSELNTSPWGRHQFPSVIARPTKSAEAISNPYKNPVVITLYNSIVLKVSPCQKHAIFYIFGGDFGGETP